MTDDLRAPFRAGLTSVGVGLAVLALKVAVALRTESVALLADAAESVVNVVAALIATAAIRYAVRPPDANHQYGHGKIEYLSAAIEGALVVLAAFVVAFEALGRFGQMPRLPGLGLWLGISLVATGANLLLARHLEKVGRKHQSPALLADALHVRSDVVTSVAVYGGISIAWLSGYWQLDALLALAVSIHILISGLRAVRQSVSGLLDEALPESDLGLIEARLADEGPPVIEHHDLRTRRAGSQVFIELHLVISRYALVYEAHEICDRIEADLGTFFPGSRVTIHVEPEGEARRRTVVAGDQSVS